MDKPELYIGEMSKSIHERTKEPWFCTTHDIKGKRYVSKTKKWANVEGKHKWRYSVKVMWICALRTDTGVDNRLFVVVVGEQLED